MKLKAQCCKSFKKKGKACKRCPIVCEASIDDLSEVLVSIKKSKARRKFADRYLN